MKSAKDPIKLEGNQMKNLDPNQSLKDFQRIQFMQKSDLAKQMHEIYRKNSIPR